MNGWWARRGGRRPSRSRGSRAEPWRPSSCVRPGRHRHRAGRPARRVHRRRARRGRRRRGRQPADQRADARRNRAPQLDTHRHHQRGRGHAGPQALGAHAPRRQRHLVHAVQHLHDQARRPAPLGQGVRRAPKTKVTHYTLSFAVAFCEGGDTRQLGRVWADGNVLDLSQYAHTFYNGSESQVPDSLHRERSRAPATCRPIAAPATSSSTTWRSTISATACRRSRPRSSAARRSPTPTTSPTCCTAVCLLPGAGEFVLGTTVYQVLRRLRELVSREPAPDAERRRPTSTASLDQLDGDAAGRHGRVAGRHLVRHRPARRRLPDRAQGRDPAARPSTPADWAVAGFTRATAPLVSADRPADARPDRPRRMRRRRPASCRLSAARRPTTRVIAGDRGTERPAGIRVMFYPFVMMDIPAGNGLPDPYGGAEQAAFPWRGRITCYPGPARPARSTRRAAAADQVAAFFAQYAAMVLHYAQPLRRRGRRRQLRDRLGTGRPDAGALERRATAAIRPCRR